MGDSSKEKTTQMETTELGLHTRDENKSPTSGSSSDTLAEEGHNRHGRNRKSRRPPKSKRKWKPYTELSYDEKKIQEDRESQRAFAKRERLSAEGHPIAPYNTTQFLMDDHKVHSPAQRRICHNDSSKSLVDLEQDACRNQVNRQLDGDMKSHVHAINRRSHVDSPVPSEGSASTLATTNDRPSDSQDDIQKYILADFSHTYAGIHAEQLQSLSKMELISECLKLEKKVDSLEKRVTICRQRHKDEHRNQADVRLLEKINQLQVLNSQLQRENASLSHSQTPEHHNVSEPSYD